MTDNYWHLIPYVNDLDNSGDDEKIVKMTEPTIRITKFLKIKKSFLLYLYRNVFVSYFLLKKLVARVKQLYMVMKIQQLSDEN